MTNLGWVLLSCAAALAIVFLLVVAKPRASRGRRVGAAVDRAWSVAMLALAIPGTTLAWGADLVPAHPNVSRVIAGLALTAVSAWALSVPARRTPVPDTPSHLDA